jgi:hypothetical protein
MGAILLAVCVIMGGASSSQAHIEPRDGNAHPYRLDNLSLILHDAKDIKAFRQSVTDSGGVIAIQGPGLLLAWLPDAARTDLKRKPGVLGVHSAPLDASALAGLSDEAKPFVSFFDAAVSGQLTAEADVAASAMGTALPLIGDAREAPVEKDPRTGKAVAGNSDAMLGTVAVALFFVESDGTIDTNAFTWSSTDEQNTLNRSLAGLAWWSSEASSRGLSVSFTPVIYASTNAACQQGYEPITHSSGEDDLWQGAIMTKLGYPGYPHSAARAFNSWLRASQGTARAYSVFIGYNPSPARSTFTDG